MLVWGTGSQRMKWIARLALVVVILAGARKLWYRNLALLATNQELTDQRRGIEGAEAELETLDRSLDESEVRLASMVGRITAIERQYPNGIPRSIYPEYSRLVAEHNDAVAEHNALVARYGALRSGYEERVGRHNARVDTANRLAARGTVCSLLPEWLQPRGCAGE